MLYKASIINDMIYYNSQRYLTYVLSGECAVGSPTIQKLVPKVKSLSQFL